MSKHVLVSPVGRSPGAVTGVLLALRAEGWPIETLVALNSNDDKVQQTLSVIADICDHPNVNVKLDDVPVDDFHTTERMVDNPFVKVLERYADHQVHICITAGFGGMSGLAVLATNFYGADHIWHYWVPDEVSNKGHIDKMGSADYYELDHINPVGKVEYKLVALPFLDPRNILPITRQFYESGGKVFPDARSVWTHLATLSTAGAAIEAFERIPPRAVEELFTIIPPTFNGLPENDSLRIQVAMDSILRKYHINDEVLRDRIWRAMQESGSYDRFHATLGSARQKTDDVLVQLVRDILINVFASAVTGAIL